MTTLNHPCRIPIIESDHLLTGLDTFLRRSTNAGSFFGLPLPCGQTTRTGHTAVTLVIHAMGVSCRHPVNLPVRSLHLTGRGPSCDVLYFEIASIQCFISVECAICSCSVSDQGSTPRDGVARTKALTSGQCWLQHASHTCINVPSIKDI